MDNSFYNSPEWMKIRAEVFRRDGYKCKDCGSIDNLQCHHLSTLNYRNPDLNCLVTLCNNCHIKRHGEQKKIEEAAIAAAGELQDGGMYRMYLIDSRVNETNDWKFYISCKFSRFVNGRFECSMAIFDDVKARKFLAVCGYNTDDIEIDFYNRASVDTVCEYIMSEIGKPFDLRVRHETEYWNVKCHEIYPVL